MDETAFQLLYMSILFRIVRRCIPVFYSQDVVELLTKPHIEMRTVVSKYWLRDFASEIIVAGICIGNLDSRCDLKRDFSEQLD